MAPVLRHRGFCRFRTARPPATPAGFFSISPMSGQSVCRAGFCHEVRIDSIRQNGGNVKMDTRPFAIVMLPPSEEGHGIALVGLKSDGSVDSGRNFLFTHRPTRGAQKSYATQLANMLGCKVIEVSE
jgi:hypothetical protein